MYLDKLKSIESLPMLPEVVLRVQRLLQNDEGNFKDLAELLEQDVSLSTAVLKTANSVLFNYSGKEITNLCDAVMRIGRGELERIVLSVSIVSGFPQSDLVDLRLLWEQAFTTSSLVKKMIKLSSITFDNAHSLTLSALFQKLGIVVMTTYFEEELLQIEAEMKRSGEQYVDSEKMLFDSNIHAELGSTLLELWRLSGDISIPIYYHLSPSQAPEKHKVRSWLLYCADSIMNLVSPSPFTNDSTEERVELLLQQCGISAEYLQELIEFAHTESDRARTMLSMWGLGESMSKLRGVSGTSLLRPI